MGAPITAGTTLENGGVTELLSADAALYPTAFRARA
jgi:hypothetical protein